MTYEKNMTQRHAQKKKIYMVFWQWLNICGHGIDGNFSSDYILCTISHKLIFIESMKYSDILINSNLISLIALD